MKSRHPMMCSLTFCRGKQTRSCAAPRTTSQSPCSRQCGRLITGNAPRARHMTRSTAAKAERESMCHGCSSRVRYSSPPTSRRHHRNAAQARGHDSIAAATVREGNGLPHSGARRATSVPAAIAAEHYRNDPAVLNALAAPGRIGKSAVAPAQTTVAGWAAEIATPNSGTRMIMLCMGGQRCPVRAADK
jgi:hypothetical protein